MTYTDVIEYLKKASLRGSVLGLSRIEKLLELLGNPQEKLKIIHVSGTNGKGSFSAMLSSVLKEAGYSAGVFSSPSLVTVNDSFCLNGVDVSDELFAEVLTGVIEMAEKLSDSPTEFELLTAAAFLMFYKSKCEICIIECGLGGDTDSTNVIKSPVLSVITNVQKDHCGILGDSISEIAMHKAGIIKHNCPVLYCGRKDEAFDIIEQKAYLMHSDFYAADKRKLSTVNVDINGTSFSFGRYVNVHLSLVGCYQAENASNVLTAVEILKKNGFVINDKAVYSGMEKAVWKGRFEVLSKNPTVIFDGAHNPFGMQEAVNTLKSCFPEKKAVMLMGVMADKEYYLYADMLREISDRIFTVTPDNPRSLKSESLAYYFNENGIKAQSCECFSDGLEMSLKYAKENEMPLVVLGSLYMYREFTENYKN